MKRSWFAWESSFLEWSLQGTIYRRDRSYRRRSFRFDANNRRHPPPAQDGERGPDLPAAQRAPLPSRSGRIGLLHAAATADRLIARLHAAARFDIAPHVVAAADGLVAGPHALAAAQTRIGRIGLLLATAAAGRLGELRQRRLRRRQQCDSQQAGREDQSAHRGTPSLPLPRRKRRRPPTGSANQFSEFAAMSQMDRYFTERAIIPPLRRARLHPTTGRRRARACRCPR